ncbi:MAG: two-component sensor histidine kinase [Ruminococcaceae bacterium]|nr:two-component sensor histidine kinase [Oscillospiraceae bacterium]
MKRKLILSLFYMGLIAALISVVATVFVYQNTMRAEVRENLENELRLLQVSYNKLHSPQELQEFASEDLRITLIDTDGKVLFESAADAEKMENHLDRPEIIEAIQSGSGSDARISSTLGIEDYYYAQNLPNNRILRVSTEIRSVLSMFGRTFYFLVLIITAIAALSIVLSVRITNRFISPIRKLSQSIDDSALYDEDMYPELVPLIEEIEYQRNIQSDRRQEFTANVSHELKTPLTAISGYAEMIESGMAKGEDNQHFASKIRAESDRMLALVSDIIALSKLDTHQDTAMEDVIHLEQIALECSERLSLAAQKKGVLMTVDGESEAFCGNQVKIYEMIYNLMDNAIKYNRQGGNVDVVISDRKITISDTGIGIPPEDTQRVFERFFRVDKSRSKETGGTGLGLSIVKHIAEQHHAVITLDSTLNVGTDITVDFNEVNHEAH